MLKKFLIFILLANFASASEIAEFVHETPTPIKDIQFIDNDNVIHNLNDFKEKVIVLNFWATWCQPCVAEMPSLSKLQQSIEGRNIIIIPLSIDYKGIPAIEEFYQEHGINNLKSFLDRKGRAFRSYQLSALPTTIIINKSGNETARVFGEIDWFAKDVRDYLVALSKE